jgi:CRP-like cAMP-binding protein
MPAIFKAHLDKFITITDSEFEKILSFFETVEVKKKENLLTEGQICKTNYFVLNGCLRKFFINEKGVEQTTEFAPETWWITDNMAYEFQRPTDFFIQAIEKSEVLTINYLAQQKLLEAFPVMERYFRFIYQRAYAASQMRIKYLYGMSKEDFYHNFNDKQPEFVQRVPQYLLASFLSITPEYLSEIRKKKRS